MYAPRTSEVSPIVDRKSHLITNYMLFRQCISLLVLPLRLRMLIVFVLSVHSESSLPRGVGPVRLRQRALHRLHQGPARRAQHQHEVPLRAGGAREEGEGGGEKRIRILLHEWLQNG